MEEPNKRIASNNTPKVQSDFVLIALIQTIIEKAKGSFGVTLFIDGQMLSGDVISFRDYLKALEEQIVTGLTGASAENDGDDQRFGTRLDELGEKASEKVQSRWIHLRNVVIYHPSGEWVEIPLWRGDLHHVGGWTLGRFSRQDNIEE